LAGQPPTATIWAWAVIRPGTPALIGSPVRRGEVMERWICARRTVIGDPAALKARLTTDIVALLQAATGSQAEAPHGDGSFHMVLRSAGGGLHKTVVASVGQARVDGPWLRIPLRWEADPLPAAFPTFDGDLEVEDLDSRSVSLALIGRYHPPASVVGGLVDRVAMSRTAERTAERLVGGLASALSGAVEVPHGAPARLLTVGQLMSPDPLVVSEDLSLRGAANLMLIGRISGLPVVDGHGQLVGILSEADLLDKVAPPRTGLSRTVEMSWRRHDSVTVGQACTRPARTTSVDATVREAAGQMAQEDVARLVVMRGATVAGILTRHDVLRALVRADEAIEAAVEDLVADSGFDGVTTEVVDGHVRLGGVIDLRSDAAELPGRLLELDGVLDVDADALRWETDDVVVPPPLWC
jgi:CBS domain-containing protein